MVTALVCDEFLPASASHHRLTGWDICRHMKVWLAFIYETSSRIVIEKSHCFAWPVHQNKPATCTFFGELSGAELPLSKQRIGTFWQTIFASHCSQSHSFWRSFVLFFSLLIQILVTIWARSANGLCLLLTVYWLCAVRVREDTVRKQMTRTGGVWDR